MKRHRREPGQIDMITKGCLVIFAVVVGLMALAFGVGLGLRML